MCASVARLVVHYKIATASSVDVPRPPSAVAACARVGGLRRRAPTGREPPSIHTDMYGATDYPAATPYRASYNASFAAIFEPRGRLLKPVHAPHPKTSTRDPGGASKRQSRDATNSVGKELAKINGTGALMLTAEVRPSPTVPCGICADCSGSTSARRGPINGDPLRQFNIGPGSAKTGQSMGGSGLSTILDQSNLLSAVKLFSWRSIRWFPS